MCTVNALVTPLPSRDSCSYRDSAQSLRGRFGLSRLFFSDVAVSPNSLLHEGRGPLSASQGLDLYQETLVVIINPVLLFELKMLQALHRAA